jgi:hypothetical protein
MNYQLFHQTQRMHFTVFCIILFKKMIIIILVLQLVEEKNWLE